MHNEENFEKINKKSSLKKTEKSDASADWQRIAILLLKIALFAVLCYIVFFVVFSVKRMDNSNMYPAIKDGDLLVYYRLDGRYENGDVVVVEKDGEEMVMRIIASGGQELDIDKDGSLSVDKQSPVFQAFYDTERTESQGFKYPYKVSEDCYFMLNDYRPNTEDSRVFGEICKDKIKGRIITRIQIRDL